MISRSVSLLGVVAGLCLLPGGRWQARAQMAPAAPMPILSDTPEYCVQLEHRIRQLSNLPADVRQLVREGHQQCDHGQVRLGIAHLRRAIMILKQRAVLPPPPS
jgi:hypothetical protein